MGKLNIYALTILAATVFGTCNHQACAGTETRPNIVIIFLDDSGYSDFSPFGQSNIVTPNVDRLAEEGIVFRNFYVPQPICSASRAALLTGCYPGRTKVFGALAPNERGLDPAFATMGEVFSGAGYKTAIFGKWHCGDQPDTRPPNRGFDESCGLMYSNDMWKHHPVDPGYWGKNPLHFWENGEVKIEDVGEDDQRMLTKWYTEHAVDFINRNKEEPFLLYVPHNMPHVPIYCSSEFEGKSGVGLYGDVLLELDWSVGQIIQALENNGLNDDTIVIFTSDNGPWLLYGNHAGTTPFREGKGTTFDGGTRSATIIKYPSKLKGHQHSESALMTIDILPTLCHLANVGLPTNEIDGANVWDLIVGKENAQNPHDYYAFTKGRSLEAIMSGDGRWKLHLPHSYATVGEKQGRDGLPGKYEQSHIELALFDMVNDPYETTNVADEHPEVVEKLRTLASNHQSRFFSDNG